MHAIGTAAVREQRPGIRWHDRGLVGPLLGRLAALIQVLLETLPIVCTEPRPRNQEMGRHQYIDVVEL